MSVVTQIVGSAFSTPFQPSMITTARSTRPSLVEAVKGTVVLHDALPPGLEGIHIESVVVAPEKTAATGKVAPKPKAKGATGAVAVGHDVDATERKIIVSPTFKLVFLTLVGLTVLCGATTIALAFSVDPSRANLQTAFEAMSSGWKLGLGAVFGLLGGKAVA